MSSGSRDSASMTRPENSGSSNWGRRERKSSETASVGISFRASVRMNPGQNDTAATLWGARSTAMSYVKSEEHTSELQSLMRISYAVFCLKKKNINKANSLNGENTGINYS